MSAIINGDSPSITFSDATTQATSAVVSGKVPYSILPTGSVLQVVQGTTSTKVTSNLSTPIDTGLTASITPKFASSKILVLVNQAGLRKSSGNIYNSIYIDLLRGSTTIQRSAAYYGFMGTAQDLVIGCAANAFLDSPATTSATTYKTQFYNFTASAVISVQDGNDVSSITLLEIAG
jgi:hypothetical protein